MAPETGLWKINEIFYSVQGEGYMVGTPMVFIRFSGCNLKCPFCDTKHEEGTQMNFDDIVKRIINVGVPVQWICLTGGEPTMWIRPAFIRALHALDYKVAIESNGFRFENWQGADWVTYSPKITLQSKDTEITLPYDHGVNEIRIPFAVGDYLPKIWADQDWKILKYLSPVFNGTELDEDNLIYTYAKVLANPGWRLSVQMHKLIKVL